MLVYFFFGSDSLSQSSRPARHIHRATTKNLRSLKELTMNATRSMTLILAALFATALLGAPSTARAGDDDDIVILWPEHNPITQAAFKDGTLSAPCWVEINLCSVVDEDTQFVIPLIRPVLKFAFGAAALEVSWIPVDPCADDDDIIFLRPEHNPITQDKFKGELTACWDFADPMADEDDIVFLRPEHNPYTQGDGDGDGIKDYWDPDDDN
jgi:hypothetical protein